MARSSRISFGSHPDHPSAPKRQAVSICRTLVVIDNRPLQQAAWSEFHAARKRLEKATRDLQRHEESDSPAYQTWLHHTWPVIITELRELSAQIDRKEQEVERAQYMAAMSGRSIKKIWKEHLEFVADPEAFAKKYPPPPEPPPRAESTSSKDPTRHDPDSEFEDFFEGLFGDFGEKWGGQGADGFGNPLFGGRAEAPKAEAKEIYRKLVQHLHPDRGGEWTPARERLWHEVQQAWAARDVDWLTRLEMDWEIANDTVRADSSPGRLKRAIADLDASRRDTERRLRDYRRLYSWRFTLAEKKRSALSRKVEDSLVMDLKQLRQQLAYLNSTIASWEEPRAEPKRPGRRSR
jgi:hypothetical protein